MENKVLEFTVNSHYIHLGWQNKCLEPSLNAVYVIVRRTKKSLWISEIINGKKSNVEKRKAINISPSNIEYIAMTCNYRNDILTPNDIKK